MSAEEILKNTQNIVWPVIDGYLKNPQYPKAFRIPPNYRSVSDFYWKINSEYPRRKGKYLRPALLMLTAQAMGIPPAKSKLAAAAMQLSEEWLLIHDDWEDNSPKRRGEPALHRLYDPRLAVNAGDALHALMWRVFADNQKKLGEKITLRIINEFSAQLIRTTLGQMAEIYWNIKKRNEFPDDDYFFIADGKTAYYTVACPMRLGAILAGASFKQLDALAEFGLYLGRCFQLVDDILDVTGNFEGKKELAGDIYEGKLTVILGHLYTHARPSDKKKILAIINKKREAKTKAEVKWIIAKMNEYGSIEYTRKLARKMRQKAERIFTQKLKFLKNKEARKRLEVLMNFILKRNH